MAVLANPHAESPPATTPGRRWQISRIRASQAMSRGANSEGECDRWNVGNHQRLVMDLLAPDGFDRKEYPRRPQR